MLDELSHFEPTTWDESAPIALDSVDITFLSGDEQEEAPEPTIADLFEAKKKDAENAAARVEYHLIRLLHEAQTGARVAVMEGIIKNLCRNFEALQEAIDEAETLISADNGLNAKRVKNCLSQNALENLIDLLKAFKHAEDAHKRPGANSDELTKIYLLTESECIYPLAAFLWFSISEAVRRQNKTRLFNHFSHSETGKRLQELILCR